MDTVFTRRERETFVVQILSRQNSTWQGTITWSKNQQTQPFRSLLEFIKLIDSAMGPEQTDGPGE